MAKKKKAVKSKKTETECGWFQLSLPLNVEAENVKQENSA